VPEGDYFSRQAPAALSISALATGQSGKPSDLENREWCSAK
jgi:hypothetical protein